VDGSAGSSTALRWAIEEAARRGDVVDAVHVWHEPYLSGAGGYAMPIVPLDDLHDAAQVVLDRTVDDVAGPRPAAQVERILVQGMPASTLLETAKGADLLVVGSRGRGGFAGLLLGSVSQQCAHHAPCPVVIVPAAV
jgi:nucleotide-binding universal stress UspA family protein